MLGSYQERRLMKLIRLPLRDSLHQWMVSTYGERCQEVDEHCICCKKWEAFDTLFDDEEFNPNMIITVGIEENA